MITEPVTDQELEGAKQIAPFATFDEQAKAIVAEAGNITVTDATQVTLIKRSKELRLKAKHTRCALETLRKEKVEGLVRETKSINSDANKIKEVLESLEARLLENEQFAERAEAARMLELKASRHAELAPFLTGPILVDLSTLSDAEWAVTLSDAKLMHETRLRREAKQKAAEEAAAKQDALRAERRLEVAPYADFSAAIAGTDLGTLDSETYAAALAEMKDAKRAHDRKLESQRLENERLKKEADEREAAAKKEREEAAAKLKAEQDAAAAELTKERAESARVAAELKAKADAEAAKIRAESAERERIASEKAKADAAKLEDARMAAEAAAQVERDKAAAALKKSQDAAAALQRAADEKKAAEEKAAADKLAAEKAAADAPDKEKLNALATKVRDMLIPDLDISRTALAHKLREQKEKFAAWIEAQAETL